MCAVEKSQPSPLTSNPPPPPQPLHVNAYTQPAWTAAVTAYEQRLAPVEAHIARDLRNHVAGMGDRPQQLLREFGRYKNLLRRPNVARELAGERATLLAQLSAYVEALDGEFETRSGVLSKAGASHDGRNLSPVVNAVVWANALRNKVGLPPPLPSTLCHADTHTAHAHTPHPS